MIWRIFCKHREQNHLVIPFGLRSLKKIEDFSKKMMTLHDELADLKSYFDGQKLDETKIDPATLSSTTRMVYILFDIYVLFIIRFFCIYCLLRWKCCFTCISIHILVGWIQGHHAPPNQRSLEGKLPVCERPCRTSRLSLFLRHGSF